MYVFKKIWGWVTRVLTRDPGVIIRAKKSKWTANSRTFSLGLTPDGREKFSLDVHVGAINWQDPNLQWREIDLTPEASSKLGYDWVFRGIYEMHVAKNGARLIYPDRNNLDRWIAFHSPTIMDGRSLSLEEGKACCYATDYDVEVIPRNTRIRFDQVVRLAQTEKSLEYQFTRNGISDKELLAYLGRPRVYERDNPEIERGMTVEVLSDRVRITYDDTDLKFPIIVDPDLNLQIEANADDVRHQDSDHTLQNDVNVLLGRSVSSTYGAGLRFIDVTVPPKASIDVAYCVFTSNANRSNTAVNVDIRAHDADASGQIADDAAWHAIVDANLTIEVVAWDGIPGWLGSEEGPDTTTPSIVDVIQEVVDRPGFNEILHLFFLDGGSDQSAFRSAYIHNVDDTKAVKLHIEYSVAALDHARRRRTRQFWG